MNQVDEIEIDGNLVPVFYCSAHKYYYVWKHAGEDARYPHIIDYQKEIIEDASDEDIEEISNSIELI